MKKWIIFGVLATFYSLWTKPLLAAENLIKNPSVETKGSDPTVPEGWYRDYFGSNTRTFSYPVDGFESPSAVKIELKSRTSGDAKWAFDNIPIKGGISYEFGDYYQANISSEIVARYRMASNRYRYVSLLTLPPSINWTEAKVSFKAPANATEITIYHLINQTGWLTTDNFYLKDNTSPNPTLSPFPTTVNPTPVLASPTPTLNPTPSLPSQTPTLSPTLSPSPTMGQEPTLTPTEPVTISPTLSPQPTKIPTNNGPNLILNGDLEELGAEGNKPKNWDIGNWGTNQIEAIYPDTGLNSSKAATIKINQISDGDGKWYFSEVPIEANTVYIFEDSYKSNAASRIVVRYTLGDGSVVYEESGGEVSQSSEWQIVNRKITPPSSAISLTVFHLIDKVGFLTIDNVSLTKYVNPNSLSEGMLSLDFDDGWESTFANGLPILNAANLKSTLYIVSKYVGAPEYASLAEIMAAQSLGHEIGSHTQTHPQLPLLDPSSMEQEISQSKHDLITMGLSPITSLAYPYGEYNDQVVALTKQAGYQSARTALVVDGGFNDKSTDHFLLKTQSVENNTSIETIKSWIETAVKNKTWLILVMHQIDNSGSEYSISPQKLQQIVDYIKATQVKVVTVSQGLEYLK
jgi:peptidoglycan/xylan/chitin deacetylase (PgdA/CDA1 family)